LLAIDGVAHTADQADVVRDFQRGIDEWGIRLGVDGEMIVNRRAQERWCERVDIHVGLHVVMQNKSADNPLQRRGFARRQASFDGLLIVPFTP